MHFICGLPLPIIDISSTRPFFAKTMPWLGEGVRAAISTCIYELYVIAKSMIADLDPPRGGQKIPATAKNAGK